MAPLSLNFVAVGFYDFCKLFQDNLSGKCS